ncbi:N-acetyl sugar amidotransferase, partial [Candidatus Marinimicrobia bacterium]|nr:N-acetyl sugar amidotransferase [Candidatus Neomarinimicrobiota bacterium]
MSNQRPASIPEFMHTRERAGAKYMKIDDHGICDACHQAEKKESIDWDLREEKLKDLLNKYRKSNGQYDCLVPGSGGKDSAFQAHILKYKYGMNPLTCTWPPILYTDYGYENFKNWINVGGFDNITYHQNGQVMQLLTKLSIENLLHPFQTFILGQKNLAPKLAAKFGIDLVFYGENEAEYGNPIADNSTSLRDSSYHTMNNIEDMYLSGLPVKKIIENYNVKKEDLLTFLPLDAKNFEETNIQIHYLGYYLRWIPQEAYYYAVENTGFKARPFRTQGTFSKYNSIDDKIDDLHYYTTYIKFGIGRATYDASQEIRNKHLTREEGQALVHRFDGEFPDKY